VTSTKKAVLLKCKITWNRYESSRSSEAGIRLGSSKNNSKKDIEKWTKIMLW